MAKSVKLKNNTYIDSSGIAHNRELLNTILNKIPYNEGRWTPKLENATVTYTRQEGRYIKIGKIVFVWWRIRGTISSVTGTRYSQISGLPYNCVYETAGTLFEHLNCCTDNTMNVLVRLYSNLICIQQDGDSAGGSLYNWASGKGTFYLSGMGVYLATDT